MVFRRTRTQGQQVTERKQKVQVTIEQDIIDQMHDQLQKLENMTKKKAVDMQSYVLRAEEAEQRMLKGDEAYQQLLMDMTKIEEKQLQVEEEKNALQHALMQKDKELFLAIQQQSIATRESGKLKLALQIANQQRKNAELALQTMLEDPL